MSRAKSIPATPGITPEEFLSGATPPPAQMSPPAAVAPTPEPVAAPTPQAATPPGKIERVTMPIAPVQAPEPVAPPQPANPAGQPVASLDPFIELQRWSTATTVRTLRALSVPGGCIVRLSVLKGAPPEFVQIAESICFVPDVVVTDGMLHMVDKQPCQNT